MLIQFIAITLTTTLISLYSQSQTSDFDRVCRDFGVNPHDAVILQKYRNNRGGDNKEHFVTLRAFLMRRQTAGRRDRFPEIADPILDANAVKILMGPPDEYDTTDYMRQQQWEEEEWIYFFNAEKTWRLMLTFHDGKLFNTSFSQLISADEL